MIGAEIKRLRCQKCLTQKQLAELSGCSLKYVYNVETVPEMNPSIKKLQAIAKVLGVTVDELIK